MGIFDVVMLTIAIVLFIAIYILYRVFNISVPCFFRNYLHIYCPACGITRMFDSILKLDFYQAFRYNSLIFVYFIILLVIIPLEALKYAKTGKFFKINNKILYFIIFSLFLYGILRNIPLFSYLEPTKVN